jgi:hypothetical protein
MNGMLPCVLHLRAAGCHIPSQLLAASRAALNGRSHVFDRRKIMLRPFSPSASLVLIGLCLSSASQAADDGSRFAAIWEKTGGPEFVARHGLNSQGYQQEFDKWTGQGFCLSLVSGYAVANQARYAAIWEKKNCPAYVARHGLTSQNYQSEFDTLVGQQGYRLKLVSGYNVGGQDRYAAIWEKSQGAAFVARHGLTAQAYQQEFDKWTGQGYCLALVSGYSAGGQDRYAAIWEKKSCPAYVARHGLSSQAYQQEFDKWTGQGFRLHVVSGHQIGGTASYAALWDKLPGPAYVARHGLPPDTYQQEFDKWVNQGYRPKLVNGY